MASKQIQEMSAKVRETLEKMEPKEQKQTAPLTSSRLDQIVIAIGASTGGTEATTEVIKNLPKDTPPIIIVQHMPEGFTSMYAQRLNTICRMEVKEAVHGDKLQRGRVLIAQGGIHLRVVRSPGGGYSVSCLDGEKISGHKPSVDAMFHSVAEVVGRNAVGIILTGMGRDGADGLLNMKQKGAFTIGQDEQSSVVYGMPMAAYNIGAVTRQGSLKEIPEILKGYLSRLE